MDETVTLELPRNALRSAEKVAARTQRRVEDVLREWIDQSAAQLPVELLSDEQVLALAEMEMAKAEQEELGELLARHREGELKPAERARLDELMQLYRKGLVRKAQAIQEAVARGVKPPY